MVKKNSLYLPLIQAIAIIINQSMRKLELIDKTQIANFKLQAFILEDANLLKAFAIFIDDNVDPFMLFQQREANKLIEIIVYEEQLEYLQSKNEVDDSNAKSNYKKLQDFVLNAENIAKESVFKDKKLEYLADTKAIKRIKQAFHIHED